MAKSPFSGPLAFVFEPIDWDALATQYRENSRKTRKGDKRPLAEIEALKAGQRRRRERLQREATNRWYANRPRKRTVPRKALVLEAMEPGSWYASVDIAQRYGWTSRQAFTSLLQLAQAGLVQQAVNPDWRPHVYRKGVPMHLQAKREPRLLWALTEAGAGRRETLLACRPVSGSVGSDLTHG